jgi:hypothetical protein
MHGLLPSSVAASPEAASIAVAAGAGSVRQMNAMIDGGVEAVG